MSAAPSRIETARRRAASAKQIALVGAAAGFVAVVLLAKASHPGTHSSVSGTSQPTQSTGESESESDDGNFGFGQSSVSPSGSAQPQAQTSVS
jgi:hypothetical protein